MLMLTQMRLLILMQMLAEADALDSDADAEKLTQMHLLILMQMLMLTQMHLLILMQILKLMPC